MTHSATEACDKITWETAVTHEPKNGGSQRALEIRESAYRSSQALVEELSIPEGAALAATGSFARREMTSKSDLDLILLHQPGLNLSGIADLWYPIWDAKMRLDYAVRTPQECANMVSDDSTAALALLDVRHVSGDPTLTEQTRQLTLETWRRKLNKNFNAVSDTAIARWRRSGSVVAMTHPDLKHGRGGLRDIELIRALALGHLCDAPPLDSQRRLLLDVRTLLHQHAGRARDVLDPEFAADIALDLGFDDRYELFRVIAQAARTINDATNHALSTARHALPRRSQVRRAVRRPIDVDVVAVDEEISLSRNPNLKDPAVVLRVAAASARTGMPISDSVWPRLENLPDLPVPWPVGAAGDFFELLSSSAHSSRVIQQLDDHGFWEKMIPQWGHIRGRMPREAVHIHTIDQHSLVVTANCAARSVSVARPDLLFLSALFHDVGKGYDRPHEIVGAEFVVEMGRKLRLNEQDVNVVETLVVEHTKISQIVGRYDPTSDKAVNMLLDAVNYDLLTLNLLESLVEADAEGTAPGVWSAVLKLGTRALCSRARARLTSLTPEPPEFDIPLDIGLVPKKCSPLVQDDLQTGATASPCRESGNATVYWKGRYMRESVRVLALIAAKGWNIESARFKMSGSDEAQHVIAELQVHNTVGTGFDACEFVQAYKSGVHSSLPDIRKSASATFWVGNILEVRTADRRGGLGAVMGVLPDVLWLTMSNPGATMIMQCELAEGFDRAKVERDVTKVLTNG
ncbi:[protein-PII] uridylyltransferase [Corynebacterium pseudotuberculosis]|uniref:[protein-PII] uridylyltransferase n=1 Tax=Corynebacterium pseudotuberculosis 258 TaxID=1168865 RepID=A0AAU8PKV2_CORPS|nr:[protein-PII] uridylyltransferase [Corynebacterium pseudotuberculosis]AEQ06880.1 [protein-PII] uridylyltransferase [Corynebacterium pseudotuberculosis CIP 52.97]AFB72682.1 [protein-PII] uridylyltransferase [Corynebacterium pseudotuberculosis 316]AFK16975.1 [protein-PII] uridylyltransferase [Corynebacterium pseudotuberculosis 258]AKS13666.1 PII uridylyl-transferase [Corynebacterium pseudotuberculosis]APQ56504.1 PII uridylyl-transferase [Corynebacterium pseudotuberculosis]